MYIKKNIVPWLLRSEGLDARIILGGFTRDIFLGCSEGLDPRIILGGFKRYIPRLQSEGLDARIILGGFTRDIFLGCKVKDWTQG